MKKKIYMIILSIVAILIIIATFLYMNSNKTKVDGSVHLYVTICENNEIIEVIDKDVDFYENEKLIDVLNRHLTIQEGTGSNKGMIIGINDCIITNLNSYYYRLVVNCEFATLGAWDLTLNDKDSVRITYTSTSDWSVGC